jgi:quercetin dioxygenase-like cupin family protein
MTNEYFSSNVEATGSLRVVRGHELKGVAVAEGVTLHPLLGERMNISVAVLEPGAVAEMHTHEEEQMGYVVSGRCDFTDGTNTWRLDPGDTYHAASGVPHSAKALDERCVIIDAFSPPRAGLRELLGEA